MIDEAIALDEATTAIRPGVWVLDVINLFFMYLIGDVCFGGGLLIGVAGGGDFFRRKCMVVAENVSGSFS